MVTRRHQTGDDYLAVLLDWKMPGMDGVEAARRIRAHGCTDAFKKDEQAAREAGMNEHLPKPISVDRLAQVLTRYLTDSASNEKEADHEKI